MEDDQISDFEYEDAPMSTHAPAQHDDEINRQRTWRAAVSHTLQSTFHFNENLIRQILRLAPPYFKGCLALPNAGSSIFATHIFGTRTAVILTRSGQLYMVDLHTGHFWCDTRNYPVVVRLRRVKSVAFHPTEPVLFAHAWNTSKISVVRYPTSIDCTQVSCRHLDFGAVFLRGLSATEHYLGVHRPGGLFSLYPLPTEEHDLVNVRLTQVRSLHFSPSVSFMRLAPSPSKDVVKCWYQAVKTRQRSPLRLITVRNDTRHDIFFYGPIRRLYQVLQCPVNDKVIGITELHEVFVWRGDGGLLSTLRIHFGPIQDAAIYNTLLFTASFDKSVRVHDLRDHRVVRTEGALKYESTINKKPQAVSVVNGRVLVAFDNKTIDIYDVE